MKAIIWTKYGSSDGLQLKEVTKPTPKDDELLIRVAAATVTAGDCEFRSLKIRFLYKLILRLYAGLLRPKRITILGQELAGAEVTAVDSAEKLEILRSLGADQIIDYAQEDFSKSAQTYDMILDVVGKSSYSRCIKSLNENGYYLLANPRALQKTRGRWTALRSSKRVISGTSDHRREDLIFLKELIEAGKLKSVIDRRYPLAETAEAHRCVETGRKKGNVIITVAQLDEA